MTEMDFCDSVLILGFPDELNQVLLSQYLDHRMEIRETLGALSMQLPAYTDLNWRIDAQVGAGRPCCCVAHSSRAIQSCVRELILRHGWRWCARVGGEPDAQASGRADGGA